MQTITTIGLDLAKESFFVYAEDAPGRMVERRELKRKDVLAWFEALKQPCLVGLEACASAHCWAREIAKFGHAVKLIPAQRVKAFVIRQKNDAADAQAICQAVRKPDMRFVPVKNVEQQSLLMLHGVRDTLVCQRTQAMNAMRGHFGEIGIVVATGPKHVAELVARVMRAAAAETPPAAPAAVPQEAAKIEEKKDAEAPLPRHMLTAMQALVSTLANLNADIAELDRAIVAALKENELAQRLATIPGIGPFIATLLAGLYPTAEGYANARAFAASLGLVPAQHSSGGKPSLRSISKMGNRDVRRLLVVGATAILWRMRDAKHKTALAEWACKLLKVKPFRLVSVALANKLARTVWALTARGGTYKAGHKPAAAAMAA
jgi:transposase